MDQIIYEHARRDNKRIGAGHWFFDMGEYVLCAGVEEDKLGKWHLYLHSHNPKRPLQSEAMVFDSLQDAKTFIAIYFESPVVDGKLPHPRSL